MKHKCPRIRSTTTVPESYAYLCTCQQKRLEMFVKQVTEHRCWIDIEKLSTNVQIDLIMEVLYGLSWSTYLNNEQKAQIKEMV